MLDENDRPEPPAAPRASAPSEPQVRAGSDASPWSRGGSPDFVVSGAPAANGSDSGSASGGSYRSIQPPRPDRLSRFKRIIVATAATAVVVASAVLIVYATRPDAPSASAAGASITDLSNRLIPIPAGLKPCRTDGQHYVAAQLEDSVVLATGVARRLSDAGLVDTASRCWVDASGVVFAVSLLRFETVAGTRAATDASLFAAVVAKKFVLPPPGGARDARDTQWSPAGDGPEFFGWKATIMYVVGTVPRYSTDDSVLKQIVAQQLARL